MKEFQLIDDVMPDVPPAGHAETAVVRARVLAAASPRRRPPVWARVSLAAAAVTGVLLAGFVVAPRLGDDGTGTASPPATAAAMATASSPSDALKRAADRLAAQPAGTGRWWRREALHSQRARFKDNPSFYVENQAKEVLWIDRQGRQRIERGGVSSTFPTSLDEREWKRAGSPPLCGDDNDCQIGRVFMAPLPLKPVTDLPAEPGALKAELLRRLPQDGTYEQESWLWSVALWVLLDTEATPAIRAAVYGMLADLPGTDIAERLFDGRTGITLTHGDATAPQQVVIEPESGELLAVQTVTTGRTDEKVVDAYRVRRLGWTDEQPATD
ncbi:MULTISPECIES: CU044_5270 family protein [unclassified Nonomuraea]|uniref:CU044_5270 family protein n=1 Tax=unclassified Nonomuraea TaxID=2593643 RepID=UPI003408DD0A